MRIIDKDALLSDIEHTIEESGCVNHEGEIMDCVRYAPELGAVPVVRCRECKSHGTLKSGELFCGKIKTGIYGYYHTVKADDYCSYGERKEDRK